MMKVIWLQSQKPITKESSDQDRSFNAHLKTGEMAYCFQLFQILE